VLWRTECTFYVTEPALSSPVGGSAVMHYQLLHLLLLPVDIRVVPPACGGFTLFGDDVVHLETLVGNVFMEKHIAAYRATASRLAEVAWDVEESRGLVSVWADQYVELP
jgi:hypothetical protein